MERQHNTAGPCGRVKLPPFWLREERGQCVVLSRVHPGSGHSHKDPPCKDHSTALGLVTLLGVMIKHPTRSNLRDEGLFGLLVQAGSPSWQGGSGVRLWGCIPQCGGSGSKESNVELSFLPLSLFIYSGTPPLGRCRPQQGWVFFPQNPLETSGLIDMSRGVSPKWFKSIRFQDI